MPCAGSRDRVVRGLVASLRQHWGAVVSDTNWLDEASRASALDKIGAMTAAIGYPEAWPDVPDVELDAPTFVENRWILARLQKWLPNACSPTHMRQPRHASTSHWRTRRHLPTRLAAISAIVWSNTTRTRFGDHATSRIAGYCWAIAARRLLELGERQVPAPSKGGAWARTGFGGRAFGRRERVEWGHKHLSNHGLPCLAVADTGTDGHLAIS